MPRFGLRRASAHVTARRGEQCIVESAQTGFAGARSDDAGIAAPSTARAGAGPRLHVIALALSLVVIIAGWFPMAPVRDAATLQEDAEVSLVRPTAYVDFAPFSDVLDAITLLSERQHVAVLLGLAVMWGLWRFARPAGMQPGWRENLRSFAALVMSVAALYAAAAYLPRPMARLVSLNPDVLRVDFHSHTQNSKDARRSYSIESSRAWHHASGYDVAYVTDHDTFAGAEQGLASNPPSGSRNTVLLSGIEVSWNGEHVGVLGNEQVSRCALTANLHDLDLRNPQPAGCGTGRLPIVVWNHPRDPQLQRLPLASGAVQAIEIANGALHSLDLVRSKRDQIVALARSRNLPLLSGTDRHGWGYAAPNWTLLRLKVWRTLDHDALAARIEQSLRASGFGATRVIERATADPAASSTALAFSVFTVPWRMLTELSLSERRMWLVWIWAIVAVEWHLHRRRVSRSEITTSPVR